MPYSSALLRKKDAVETAMELAGALFVKGAMLDFEAINLSQPTEVPSVWHTLGTTPTSAG